MGLNKGKGWPDADVMETLPKIIKNLSLVSSPTGFESWMVIKKDTFEIIGDAGFKGRNAKINQVDIGYGVIKEERRKGYAEEAVRALIKWAFSTELVSEITASCLLDNINSINLLTKIHFMETTRKNGTQYWSLKHE